MGAPNQVQTSHLLCILFIKCVHYMQTFLKCQCAFAKARYWLLGLKSIFCLMLGCQASPLHSQQELWVVVFPSVMHLTGLNAQQVMVLKRSRFSSKDDMHTFNSWCLLLNKRESESNKIKAEYYCLVSDSLWRITVFSTQESGKNPEYLAECKFK